MESLSNIFGTPMFRKIVPVLVLLYVALVGCTNKNANTEIPKPQEQETANTDGFAKLEEEFNAKLGIFALDTGTNQTVTYHPDERFAYASTHKALAVGVLLQQKSIEDLNQRIIYTREDLVNYNPITEENVDTGMTLKELADASLRFSDNTAQNLILKQIGGPTGLKKALEEIGDNVTNPERYEPDLNEVHPGDRKSTRLNSSHVTNSYAVFCFKKNKNS